VRDLILAVDRVFYADTRTLDDPLTGDPVALGTRWVGASTVELEYLDQDVGAIRVNGTLVARAEPRPGEHWAPEAVRLPEGGDYTVALGARLAITAGATVNPGGGDPEDPDGPDVPAPGGSVIVDADTAPVDLPVALRRGTDGRFRPDRAAIADRPTRVEVTAEIGTSIAAHAIDPDPHPAYDDIPDLTLWYRNALL
jgi:hypothetical protein